MAYVKGSREEFERFSHNMSAFASDMRDTIARIRGQYAGLDAMWEGADKARYEDQLQEAIRVLQQIAEGADEQSRYLWEKAVRIGYYEEL